MLDQLIVHVMLNSSAIGIVVFVAFVERKAQQHNLFNSLSVILLLALHLMSDEIYHIEHHGTDLYDIRERLRL